VAIRNLFESSDAQTLAIVLDWTLNTVEHADEKASGKSEM
jgi:hypothetical protein